MTPEQCCISLLLRTRRRDILFCDEEPSHFNSPPHSQISVWAQSYTQTPQMSIITEAIVRAVSVYRSGVPFSFIFSWLSTCSLSQSCSRATLKLHNYMLFYDNPVFLFVLHIKASLVLAFISRELVEKRTTRIQLIIEYYRITPPHEALTWWKIQMQYHHPWVLPYLKDRHPAPVGMFRLNQLILREKIQLNGLKHGDVCW